MLHKGWALPAARQAYGRRGAGRACQAALVLSAAAMEIAMLLQSLRIGTGFLGLTLARAGPHCGAVRIFESSRIYTADKYGLAIREYAIGIGTHPLPAPGLRLGPGFAILHRTAREL